MGLIPIFLWLPFPPGVTARYLMEGAGFEPSVPREIGCGFEAASWRLYDYSRRAKGIRSLARGNREFGIPARKMAFVKEIAAAGCHALRRGKGLDQSAANSRPQNLHSRAVAIIGSRQYGQGARSSAVAVPGFMHAQTSAATHPNKVQPRSRLRTKMAPRL
jgi:hypothetical protein